MGFYALGPEDLPELILGCLVLILGIVWVVLWSDFKMFRYGNHITPGIMIFYVINLATGFLLGALFLFEAAAFRFFFLGNSVASPNPSFSFRFFVFATAIMIVVSSIQVAVVGNASEHPVGIYSRWGDSSFVKEVKGLGFMAPWRYRIAPYYPVTQITTHNATWRVSSDFKKDAPLLIGPEEIAPLAQSIAEKVFAKIALRELGFIAGDEAGRDLVAALQSSFLGVILNFKEAKLERINL